MSTEINFQGTPSSDDPAAGGDTGQAPAAPENQDQGFLEYNGKQLSKEDVLKKLESADGFIETLKTERQEDRSRLDKLEEALANASKTDDILNALNGGSEPAKPDPAPAAPAADQGVDLEALLDQKLAAREAAKKAEANWTEVTTALGNAFGDSTNTKVAEVAEENGFTLKEAQEFARSKPKAFLKLFGDIKPASSTPLAQGQRRSAPQAPAAPNAPTGYGKARTDKERISVYQQKLSQLGL